MQLLVEYSTRPAECFTRLAECFTRLAECFTRLAEYFTRLAEYFTSLAKYLTRLVERFTRLGEYFPRGVAPSTEYGAAPGAQRRTPSCRGARPADPASDDRDTSWPGSPVP